MVVQPCLIPGAAPLVYTLHALPLQCQSLVCLCSVQYLEQPEQVFAEIYRVLAPGGACIITFSNRLYYEKAIAAWRDGSGYSRQQLVASYFQSVEGFTQPEKLREVALEGAPAQQNPVKKLWKLVFGQVANDPFYAVVAYRNYKRVDE